MTDLRIQVLGDVAILRDGQPMALPRSKKTRALLAFLALDPGPHRRERLCELFWTLPDDPRGSLRWSLSKIRPLVNDAEAERITADREHVAFHPGNAVVDLLEIQEQLSAGTDDLDLEALTEMAEALKRGCLVGLDLAEDLDFHYFLTRQRLRARELQATVLKALTKRLADHPAEAIPWFQALVELEPEDAGGHLRLIEGLALAGRRKEAERQAAVSAAALKGQPGMDAAALLRAAQTRPRGVVPLTENAEQGADAERPASARQQVRFCKAADGTRLAYATTGQGPPLVKTANWLSHLEHDWDSPVWRHVYGDLTASRRLIRYDARGHGLSDWDVEDYSFDAMVSDLETVVDACGLERFDMFALSQGCAVGVEYAARHPERVSRLVLFGGYARGWNRMGSRKLETQAEAMMLLVRMGWGHDHAAFRQMFTSMFMPDAPPQNHEWFNELQRLSSTAENAARLIRACGDVDVRSRLADVRAPTLVLHSRYEVLTPFNRGRELAAGIPGARFVGLDTRNHLLPAGDPAYPRWLQEVRDFLAPE
jgi:DNA-binding SARP family transcriptional activator/pimeloyl-ACP methyl ester carboxylesterase